MAVLNVVKIGDPILRQECLEVKKINANIEKLLDNMADTMHAELGVGLAAPQVGIPKRVMIVEVEDRLIEFVNPVIIKREGKQYGEEGCLSIPGEFKNVIRSDQLVVKAQDRSGKEFQVTASGLLARAIEHEIDHLDGILFVDRVEESAQ